MAGKTHEVNVKFMADLADFQAQLAAMPDMSAKEAKKAVNALIKQQQKLEKATKASTKATLKSNRDQFKKFRQETDKAEDSLKKFEDAAGETDTIVSALAGGLSEISPEIGGFVSLFAEGASVLEATARSGQGLAAIVAPLAVVVGGAALAYDQLQKNLQEANEKIETQRENLEEMQGLYKAVKEQSILLAVAEGRLSQEQADRMVLATSAAEMFGARLEEQAAKTREANAALIETQSKLTTITDKRIAAQAELTEILTQERNAQIGVTDALAERTQAQLGAQAGDVKGSTATRENTASKEALMHVIDSLQNQEEELSSRVLEQSTAYNAQTTALENLQGMQKKYIDQGVKLKQRDEDAKAASKAKTAAFKEEEEAQRAIAAAEQERADQMALVDAEIDKIIANENKLASLKNQLFSSAEALAVLNPMEKLAKDEEAALTRFDEMSLKALQLAEEQGEDLVALDQKIQDERLELEEAYAQKRIEINEKIVQKEQDLNRQRMRDALNLVDTIAQAELDRRTHTIEKLKEEIEAAEGHLTATQIQGLEERLEANQKAAQRAFKAQQAAAIAGVVMSTAESVMKTMAQFGFPIGLIPAGMAAAMGGAQIASILSQSPPKFHTGGAVDNQAPDEFDIRVTRPEMVLNPTGAAIIGRDTVAAANAGTLGSQNQTVVVQWRNRVLDVVTADVARRPSPIRSAINRNRRAGHKR